MLLVEREDDAEKRGARVRAMRRRARRARRRSPARRLAGAAPAGPRRRARCARPPAGGAIDLVMRGANGTAYDAREAGALRRGARRARAAAPPGAAPSANRSRRRRSASSPPCTSSSAARPASARARARLRPGRRQRRRRPRARLMSRTTRPTHPRTRTPKPPAKLPRVVARKPRHGDVHPLSPTAIRAFLRALPAAQLEGLARIELRARIAEVGRPSPSTAARSATSCSTRCRPASGGCRRSTAS